ncbi:MOP flippase family protein [Nodosilinea sp. LEGE 07298]|uniref:MOP flippase family protein n=1 Tax=Nodosilinea sp. LEGE 07298 TaxID=2777970 RepID=UPI00187FF234|nr:MOP flippase family protein [Nodosilinea sp. LEGE 07298]MBE9109958.1 MOP flippase family protein [Nodosilinea sp. LEGE 07298]
MGLHNKAIKGVFWSACESWGRQAFTLAVFVLLARLLDPETFGLVALASIFTAFMQLFLDQGLAQALIQREDIEDAHLNTAFWISFLIGLFLTITSLLLAPLISSLFKQAELIPIIRVLSIGFVFGSLSSVQDAILTRELKFKSLAIRTLIATFISGCSGIMMALAGLGVWSLVGQQIINNLASTAILWQASSWRPKFSFSIEHGKELFGFGINVAGFNILNFFNKRTDDLLVGYYLGPVELGYYSVAYRIYLIASQVLISVISKVTLPTFSKLQNEPERLVKAFYEVTKMSSAVTFPMFLGISALAPELVPILFGDQWQKSVPVMQILMLIGPVHTILIYNSSILMAMGKPSWRLGIHFINVIANVLGFVIVAKWGIVAVATAYVVRGYLLLPLSILAINKLVKVSYLSYLSQYFSPFYCTLLMLSVVYLGKYACYMLNLNNLSVLLICTFLGALSYLLSVMFFAPSLFQKLQTSFQSLASSKA